MNTRRNLLQSFPIALIAGAAGASSAASMVIQDEARSLEEMAAEVVASCEKQEGGKWKADLSLDVGMIMIRRLG